jgi:hypothetical protein
MTASGDQTSAIANDAIHTALGILDVMHRAEPNHVHECYTMLTRFIDKHGPHALAPVWLIWGRAIITAYHERGQPVPILWPEGDGDPTITRLRRVVDLSTTKDGEGIITLIDEIIGECGALTAVSAALATTADIGPEPLTINN